MVPAMRNLPRSATTRLAVLLALLGLALRALPAGAADEDPPPHPPAEEPEPPAAPLELPGLVVHAPRLFGEGEERSHAGLRRDVPAFEVPYFLDVVGREDLVVYRSAASLRDALRGLPGVLLQRTAPLQASPFIRGFTGYYNVLLIDGIRLNHSAFRAGPNQYWSTVDPWSLDEIEVLRGPHSVLYGSDAVGGTLNAMPRRRHSFAPGVHAEGRWLARAASAEQAAFGRAEVEGNRNDLGWLVGATHRRLGDLISGDGLLPGTGGIDEWDADARVDWRLGGGWSLAAGWQHVRQYNAPRTEQTVDAVPFHGTAVGSELKRDFDQERDLAYARLGFDHGACCTPFSRGFLGVSWHRHGEERDRERTGGRRDLSGFEVDQYGVQLQLESPTRWGRFTYGAEWYHDEVRSFKDNFLAGVFTGSDVQGPLGDEGTYDLLGVYVQDHADWGRLDVYAGARWTYASARADRVDNPAVGGSDPTTPGNVIAVDGDWSDLVGSLRAVYRLAPRWNLFGGASQGFRAPSLSDLTALESTSVVESPAPDLESERFLAFELGAKHEAPRWRVSVAGWLTLLDDTIIRSPTGALIDGTPEVRKDNIGDGHVMGVDLEAAWQPWECLRVFGTLSFMDGEVDQLDPAGVKRRRPLDRTMPLSFMVGARLGSAESRFWTQAELLHQEDADRLSFRDETDVRRIPPGGTPAWTTFNWRVGARLGRDVTASLGVENLFDENYRIHGSGVNEVGRNFVLTLAIDM